MSGLFSLGAIRGVSGLAKSAIETIGDKAASLTKATSASFSQVMAETPASSDADSGTKTVTSADRLAGEPISRIREKLADAVTQLLSGIGIPLDPPLAFIAGEDGQLHLENTHPRAAEIEANLRDSPEVRSLTGQLLTSSSSADRRLVLHSVSGV